MTVDEYVRRLPSIHSMLQDNHIHSDVAFFLARPMFAHAINVSRHLFQFLHTNDDAFTKLLIECISLFQIISKIPNLILKDVLSYSLLYMHSIE